MKKLLVVMLVLSSMSVMAGEVKSGYIHGGKGSHIANNRIAGADLIAVGSIVAQSRISNLRGDARVGYIGNINGQEARFNFVNNQYIFAGFVGANAVRAD